MKTMSDERYKEITCKEMDVWNERDWRDMIREEKKALDDCKPFKDWVKEQPDVFPPLKLIYEKRLEKSKVDSGM